MTDQTSPNPAAADPAASRQVPISEAMQLAARYHEAGELAEAESIYRAVLQADADHAAAKYNLALVALQGGRASEALPVLQRALQREPGRMAHWLNCAVALAGAGQPEAARRLLLQARRRGFDAPALSATLGQVERMMRAKAGARGQPGPAINATEAPPGIAELRALYSQGRHADVVARAEALWPSHSRSLELAQMLGSSLQMAGQLERALEVLSHASDTWSADPTVQRLKASVLHRMRRDDEAQAAIERTLELAPDDFGTFLLASANAVAMLDPERADRFAQQAQALKPGHPDSVRVSADAAALAGDHPQAVALYRALLTVAPDNADLLLSLGFSLTKAAQPGEAVSVLRRALELRPNDPKTHSNLGAALFRLGDTVAARGHLRTASDLAPESAEFHTAYLFCLSHDANVDPRDAFAEHVRLGALIEAPRVGQRQPHTNDRDPDRPLRIGFVSGDLRAHAVAYFVEPVWRSMSRGPHHVVAYSNFPREDEVSERLRALVDDWHRVDRLDDVALAHRIREDRIDVLFDLSGHTSHNRLAVFAMKPAPVQVSWIGYPGTTGMPSIDYRFVRTPADGDGADESLFVEKLVRLRHRGFQPAREAPPVNDLPALASGFVTFGSFNRPSKISDLTIALWSRVLSAVPGSRMLVAGTEDAPTRERLRELFATRGIDPERLDFRAKVPLADYLALHHEVDIALDTFPYSGSTTTSHALWMGVPVVTLRSNLPQQGQGGAFLMGRLGLHDWRATSPDAFVDQAVRAASDLPALQRLRQQLRERITSTFGGATEFEAAELDAALRTIWRRWCAGLPPASVTVGDAA